MPTYEYVCPQDGSAKSVESSMADYDSDRLVKCPKCKRKMRRKWSPPGIEIK